MKWNLLFEIIKSSSLYYQQDPRAKADEKMTFIKIKTVILSANSLNMIMHLSN